MTNFVPLPLLAFGFGQAWMLGWLAAAAVPVLIHLWNRRRFQEVPWAATTFLLAALRKNARRVRVEQWLLLAIRTAIVALVVTAVAGPYLEQASLTFFAGQRTHKVLVIDGSFPMAYKAGDTSLFDRARQIATEVVEQSNQGDGFTLVLMGAPPRVIVGTPAFDRASFESEIQNLKQPHGGGDLAATLVKVEEILQTAERDYPRLQRQEVHFLTDLGRTRWSAHSPEFLQRAQRLAKTAKLLVVDLGQPDAENMAVTSLAAADPYLTISGTAALQATVKNFGARPQEQSFEWLVDGERIKQQTVSVQPGRSETVTLSQRFETPGNHLVEAHLSGDSLDVDNHRWLVASVKPALRVLCVDGKPASPGKWGASHYVKFALDPDAGQDAHSPVQVEVVSEGQFSELDLSHYDCVFLCDVGQFTAADAHLLDAYLKHGGGLVFIMGDRVLPDRYNQLLAGTTPDAIHVLPARLEGVVGPSQFSFDPLDYRHPLLGPFRGNEEAGLLKLPTYKYMKLKVPDGSAAQVAMAFRETGDPAIVVSPMQRGRVVLLATSVWIDREDLWSPLAVFKNVRGLMQEVLAAAVARESDWRNVEVGSALEAEAPAASIGAPVTIHTPDDRSDQVRVAADADAARWSYLDTSVSGVYSARSASGAVPPEVFAVNVDTTNSDLTKLDKADLPAGFTLRSGFASPEQAATAPVETRSDIHLWLLYTVLALVLAETSLAWWFGYRAS